VKDRSIIFPTDAIWPHDERENLLEKFIRLGSFGAVCLFILFFTGWAPLPFWYEERSLHVFGAVVVGGVFGGPPKVPFVPDFLADRPFMYVIRDIESGSILFVGRMTAP